MVYFNCVCSFGIHLIPLPASNPLSLFQLNPQKAPHPIPASLSVKCAEKPRENENFPCYKLIPRDVRI